MSLMLLLACTSQGEDTAPDTAAFDTSRTLETASYSISWAPDPDPIPFNDYFDLTFTVVPAPTDFAVQARMPSHGHGMNVDPPLVGDGETWTMEGALFHMSGHWEIVATADGETAVFHTLVEAR